METCEHCSMEMKPIIDKERGIAECEFCGKLIAVLIDGRWIHA